MVCRWERVLISRMNLLSRAPWKGGGSSRNEIRPRSRLRSRKSPSGFRLWQDRREDDEVLRPAPGGDHPRRQSIAAIIPLRNGVADIARVLSRGEEALALPR